MTASRIHRSSPPLAHAAIATATLLLATACTSDATRGEPNYLVGAGMADITGPIVDVGFTGYSQPTHIANGVHTRLNARAFIIGELDDGPRLVYVVADLLNVSHELRLEVVDNLQAEYGETYSLDNVVLSATHTHSSPGGYRHDSALRQAYFDAVVAGITDAIVAAHESLAPGTISIGQRPVDEAGANRSLVAYEQNPEDERARYTNDTDKEMTLLKLEGDDGVIGVLSWFAVHPTSLTFNNTLVSADHKGFAAAEMEKEMRGRIRTTDDFVAAFAQSNCGDVTGNLNLDNTGPGVDDYDSARIIGQRQLDVATALMASASERLEGGVDYRLTAVDFTDLEVGDAFTGAGTQRTCFSAYGYAYAGGSTEDGAGHPLFMEGMLQRDPSIDQLVQLVVAPPPISDDLRDCQAPKPILYPKRAQPPIPIGMATIGQLALVFVPSEVTTMSGRRMREVVKNVLGDSAKHIMIAGYSNDYAGYITTPEEYAVQQYEGGHTLFGPWTLPAFLQELDRVARALADGVPITDSADQGDLRGSVESLPIGNEYDEPPTDASFGDVAMAPEGNYAPGESMTVSFWTGHPDNGSGGLYFEVQQESDGDWLTVATEADWSTKGMWTQASRVIPPYDPLDPFAEPPPPINEAFTVAISWDIPDDVQPGTYRVLFYGTEKPQETGEANGFETESPAFEVVAP